MKLKKYIIYVFTILVSLNSCNILDVDPLDSFTDAAVWGDLTLAEVYLNTSYARMKSEVEKGSRWASLTDEMHQRHTYGTEVYRLGYINCDNSGFGWENDMWNPWSYNYRCIKEINIFFANIENVPTPNAGDDEWKEQLIGQAHFLRGYFYLQLYSLFGRIPLIGELHSLDTETYDEKRASLEDVAAFVVNEFDEAIKRLPVEYSSGDQFGRATKGAAMAFKARTLLFAASPLYDDNYPTRTKWEAAAQAHKDVIDLGVYYLRQVNDNKEYAQLFFDRNNPETIFQKLFDQNGTVGNNAAFLHQAPPSSGSQYEGWGTVQPTHNLIMKFQMNDGSSYIPGDETEYPWNNRDMRFHANILLDGENWGYGENNRPVEFYIGAEGTKVPDGQDSEKAEVYRNATLTGYLAKKFLDPNYDTKSTNNNTSPWIFMRLAEIYLGYAECLIELGQNGDALKYINEVRTRAHMPPATGADIRAEYEYERQMELLFEGQRFFDIRRWKIAEDLLNGFKVQGIQIIMHEDGTKTYEVKKDPLETRVFYPRMYWMPIPRAELRKAPQLDALPYE
ncbi:MAG: RagB/SusD family nutrient uptake outer membrane protein [Tannerellaceae bacterium]|nr:RagB/SusD family nutrient uptake outer membrane protein [Tannerellaceae bacterium]